MSKWILWLVFFFGMMSCQSETKSDSSKILLPSESGTAALPSQVAVPLIFFLKEMKVHSLGNKISLRDNGLFRSLPPGVYPIESDTIVFGKAPKKWISSGISRWPTTGKVALADFIILDNSLITSEIAIFPQKPSKNGYLPGCFGCPDWMAPQYATLLIFWEKHSINVEF